MLEDFDLRRVENLAREAGKIALGHFRKVRPERKPDRTMVTVADRKIEEFLRTKLSQACPNHGILGEEFGGFEEAKRFRRVWALDPIDGTVAFTCGLPVWAVSIGLLEEGKPVAGVVYLPLIDEMYSAVAGAGARFNGDLIAIPAGTQVETDDFLLVTSNAHRRYRISFAGKCRSLGSTAAHVVLSAKGTAWGTVLGRVNLWDIAGGAAVIHEAGGRLEYVGSGPVDYRELMDGTPARDHIIGGTPSRLEKLREWVSVVT